MYQLTHTTDILRQADQAYIPTDPANTDYADYLLWCEEGNTPDPFVPPAPAPERTAAEKLAAAGLTIDELKGLLGLD